MVEKIVFENSLISNFEGLVSRDLDLDFGSGHATYLRASLIDLIYYTYMPNFIEIEETFCKPTDVGRTDI